MTLADNPDEYGKIIVKNFAISYPEKFLRNFRDFTLEIAERFLRANRGRIVNVVLVINRQKIVAGKVAGVDGRLRIEGLPRQGLRIEAQIIVSHMLSR